MPCNFNQPASVSFQDTKASRFLVENIALLPGGRALDVAMGRGRNTLYMAGLGFEMDGIDISPESVGYVLELARERGLNIKGRVADLEKRCHIEKGGYDVIICFNFLQRSLIQDIKNGLRVGGMVVYETFTVEQIRFGRPKNPDYLLEHNELLDMFRDFRCLRYREGVVEGRKAIAGIVAEKI